MWLPHRLRLARKPARRPVHNVRWSMVMSTVADAHANET